MDQFTVVDAPTKYGNIAVYRRNNFAVNFAKQISTLDYEKDVVRILEEGWYDVFVDVGACFGYHSLIASNYCKQVYAFEPHPIRFGFLEWNCLGRDNIDVSNKAIGSMPLYLTNSMYGMVGTKKDNRTRTFLRDSMPLYPLLYGDSYTGTDANILVKIDTEGFEKNILDEFVADGGDLINDTHIRWIVEQHGWASTENDITSLFTGRTIKKLERKENANTFLWYVI